MAQTVDKPDFSGLFKLDVLVQMDIVHHSFYELGLKKFFAFSNDKELVFLYINSEGVRSDNKYHWDFLDNPIYGMCFEPSGTWTVIVSDQKVLLVPFLPLFSPENAFDCKWSLSSVTVLPLGVIQKPSSVVWWLTRESENILIIGSKPGTVVFYSLESQSIVGECKVSGELVHLQICFDDSLDLLTLLISGGKSQQWKLILEHRSFGYNWLQQVRNQNDKDKKNDFMSYIKQLSKDKITLLIQGGSKDGNKSQAMEYMIKPVEYLPVFRKVTNNWALTAQYVNGRHFLTAFELNEGTLILESPEEDTATRTIRPNIKKDGLYTQGLWSQRLIYLLRKNEVEIHSTDFCVILSGNSTKRNDTDIWTAPVIGDVRRAYLVSTKAPPPVSGRWRKPTTISDLNLPRFNLEHCFIVTDSGAYVVNTICDPCEWLVDMILQDNQVSLPGLALGAPMPALLAAAAEMLLRSGQIERAEYLYELYNNENPDGWVARLGALSLVTALNAYKPSNSASLSNAGITLTTLATLYVAVGDIYLHTAEKRHFKSRLTSLAAPELTELASVAAAFGIWEVVPKFSLHYGHPSLMLKALKHRNIMCRGAIEFLLNQKCLVPYVLDDNAEWLFQFLNENCTKLDSHILKRLCIWLNPLQDQLRVIMRDMKQNISSVYTNRMLQLIDTFMRIVCTIEAYDPRPDVSTQIVQNSETWRHHFAARRALACGLGHWAVADEGNAKIMVAETPVKTELIGRVIDVACGRHHTLVLTENGIYAAGDNSYGQLGVGSSWAGAIGDEAGCSGSLLHVDNSWTAPLVSVAAGHYHSAAIDAGGRLYTWGWGVHGQLGLGNIDDQCTPQLVTKLQGRKVLSVGCGCCHSVVLMKNGEVWSFGAGAFGQLGTGGRDKTTVPVKVQLTEPIEAIAIGYFHNLALTASGSIITWGGSPQQVRAAHAARNQSPTPYNAKDDQHLVPTTLNTIKIRGRVVKMAAGWHHSCILDSKGNIYTWGLNFDGQLGSGDRKQIHIPSKVTIKTDSQPEDNTKENCVTTPEAEDKDYKTKSLIACGGDFTVFIDDDGRIYGTGNMHNQVYNEKEKGSTRVIMMKTTKRVIKIPADRSGNINRFRPIDRIDIMFPFDIDDLQRRVIDPWPNPIKDMEDFDKKSWVDDTILLLKPWIKKEILASSLNMAAKFAYHNKMFSESLRLLLNHLNIEIPPDPTYYGHKQREKILQNKKNISQFLKLEERINNISLSILNNEPYPLLEDSFYKQFQCICEVKKYLLKEETSTTTVNAEKNLSIQAADIIDKCIGSFPVDAELWETCFRHAKNFYLDNNLSVVELERVLRKYMESNCSTMAAAIMYSNDCAQYSQILSPKFYLNMCSGIVDSWV